MTSFNTALGMGVFSDISKALPKRRICEVFDSFPVVWRSETNLATQTLTNSFWKHQG